MPLVGRLKPIFSILKMVTLPAPATVCCWKRHRKQQHRAGLVASWRWWYRTHRGCCGGDYELQLSADGASRSHNLTHVPDGASQLTFNINVTNASPDDRLLVTSATGDVLASDISLAVVGQSTVRANLPAKMKGSVSGFQVSLLQGGAATEAVVRLDDFEWVAGGSVGDVFSVNAQAMFPGQSYEITGVLSGTSETPLSLTTHPVRGDISLSTSTLPAGAAGFILFPERMESGGGSFETSGRFYFAPGTAAGIEGDNENTTPGFQGDVVVLVKVDGIERRIPLRIVSGFSSVGSLAITDGTSPLDVARLQQRLRYLGYVDGNANPLVVDGIRGALTQRTVSLFNGTVAAANLVASTNLSAASLDIINAANAPFWTTLATPLVANDFVVAAGASVQGASWATELFRQGVRAARLAGMPTTIPVEVLRISAAAGGPINGVAQHESGMDLDVTVPASIQTASTGTALTATESSGLR